MAKESVKDPKPITDLSKEELLVLLSQKEEELIKAQQQIVKSEHKAVALSEKIALMQTYPTIAEKQAELDYSLKMAKQFSDSRAFTKDATPEQIYVLMKAGAEMGLKEVESLQSLYIVNGQIDFYGDKMIAQLTKHGYKVEYINEVEEKGKEKVTAVVTSRDGKFKASETATSQDQIILQSKAAKFALKNKLRFHAVRMIASFHLPHLFGSVGDQFTKEFTEWEEANKASDYNSQQKAIPTRADQNTEDLKMDIENNPEVQENYSEESIPDFAKK